MDYADIYGQDGSGVSDPPWDAQSGPPGDPPPGYHWDPVQGWVANQVDPTRNPTRSGEHVNRPDPDPTTPAPAPPPPAPPPPNIGGGALAPFSEPAPVFPTYPAFQRRPDFQATTFTAPTLQQAMDQPGYKFRVQQGQDSLQNWAAARGTLNDSGSAKALIDYGQNAAEQGYAGVYAQDMGTWQANEADRYNAYSANEGVDERAYGMNRQTQSIDPWTAAYNAWAQRGNFYLNNQGTVANTALGFAQLG